VNLLVSQLKAATNDLPKTKNAQARVVDKVDTRGGIVIGIILEKKPWDDRRSHQR
jgi:hypothetical protein